MLRSLVLAVGLFVAAPALACGGADCGDKAPCKMKSTADTTAALAEFDKATGDKLTLQVKGMKCGACSDKVVAALKAVEGVKVAAVSHETGEAKVAFDGKKVDSDKILAAVKGLGYEAKLAEA